MRYIANPVEVEAQVITSVGKVDTAGTLEIWVEGGRKVYCDRGMIARYMPLEGDYLVTQEDGYVYLNPKEVFERKYHPAP